MLPGMLTKEQTAALATLIDEFRQNMKRIAEAQERAARALGLIGDRLDVSLEQRENMRRIIQSAMDSIVAKIKRDVE